MQYLVFYSLSDNHIKCSHGIISEVQNVPRPPNSSPDTNWVSCDSTQFWYYLPKDSFRFHKLSFSPTRLHSLLPADLQSVLSPDCYLCIWLTGYNEGFPPPAPWTSGASCKFRLFFTCTSDWLTVKQVPKIPFLDSSVAHRTEKHFTHQIICLLWQDITGKQPNGRDA